MVLDVVGLGSTIQGLGLTSLKRQDDSVSLQVNKRSVLQFMGGYTNHALNPKP